MPQPISALPLAPTSGSAVACSFPAHRMERPSFLVVDQRPRLRRDWRLSLFHFSCVRRYLPAVASTSRCRLLSGRRRSAPLSRPGSPAGISAFNRSTPTREQRARWIVLGFVFAHVRL